MRFSVERLIWVGVILVLTLSAGTIFYLFTTSWGGVVGFQLYNNKEVLNPYDYDTYILKEGEVFNFSSLYIEHPYTRKTVLMQDEVDALYKKKIDWSTGNVTEEEYKELQDLLGYHLNKGNKNIVVTETPKTGDLAGIGEDVVYRIDNKGTLYLNQFIKEYDSDNNLIKSYVYQFKLKYNTSNGMIEIN